MNFSERSVFMEITSEEVDYISFENSNITIPNKNNQSVLQIFVQQRKTKQIFDCHFSLDIDNIFIKVEENLPRGRYDLFMKTDKSILRIHYSASLKLDVPERYNLLYGKSDKTFAYFTMDGHLAIQVIDVENNGHFNQFSGKMTVDGIFINSENSVTLEFQSSHNFNDLDVFFMELQTTDLTHVPFQKDGKNITLFLEKFNFSDAKLLVIKYINKGVRQCRWIDFSKLINSNLDKININNVQIDYISGIMNFNFTTESRLPITNIELIVRNRSTREEIKVLSGRGDIKNVKVNANNFPTLPNQPQQNLDEVYDGNIFDFLVRPVFASIPMINYRLRLDFNDKLEDEYWFKKSKKISQLVMLYRTKIGKLAARFSYLTPKALNFYQNAKRDKREKSIALKKKVLLVSEYIDKAQDTGMIFFKYMVDNHRDEFDTYYIITRGAKDLSNLKDYMDNVVFFRSEKHISLVMEAKYLAHSHSSIYAYPFNSKRMNMLRLNTHKIFLQHGIMGVRDLGYLYKYDPLFTNKIVVSSEREKKIAINNLNYPKELVALTGLSRFDRLMRYKKINNRSNTKKILIMPSWRKGQNQFSDEDFVKTDFFKEWQGLIEDSQFVRFLEKNEVVVNFYLHHNFQQYQHLFSSPLINFISEGDISVQNLLIEHDILITDFSSVGLDFSLLNRPVLYFNFDGMFDLLRLKKEHFLPGPVFTDRSSLIDYLSGVIRNPTLGIKYKIYQRKNLYKYSDTLANKRIYEALRGLDKDGN